MANGVNISSISRVVKDLPAQRNHPFNAKFALAYESWKNQGQDIVHAFGMRSVMENTSLFDSYANDMFGDIQNEDAKAALNSLLSESRMDCLRADMSGQLAHEDGSVSNVTTLAYLNGPVLRAIWARSIVPALMKVVPLKQTSYVCTFDIPYIYDNGVRKNLPYDLVDSDEPLIGLRVVKPIAGTGSAYIDDANNCINKFVSNISLGNLLEEGGVSADAIGNGAAIDNRVFIKNIVYREKLSGTWTDSTYQRRVAGVTKPGKAGDYLFMAEWDAEVLTSGNETTGTSERQTIGIMGSIDLATGRYRISATSPAIKSFEWEARLSSEDNRTPVSIRTEQHSLEVMLGKGQHIHIDTPVELLQEYPLSHQGSDYVVAMTDILSETISGNMNLECLSFLRTDLQAPSSAQYLDERIIRGSNQPDKHFKLHVAHGNDPTAYNDKMLKRCVSYYINKIRSWTRLEDGYWSIIGHLNNIDLLPDFKTEGFASINGDGNNDREDVYGFKVGYIFGFTSNIINSKVRCMYTPECRMTHGLHGFFTSTDDRRPTYIFHPFSYTISRGYQNPGNTLVPTVMATKRHMFQNFCPSAFQIKIDGNDESQFTAVSGVPVA